MIETLAQTGGFPPFLEMLHLLAPPASRQRTLEGKGVGKGRAKMEAKSVTTEVIRR